MSELQTSLLGIGIAVIVAVYFYNFWLQRQYRRKFGDAFKQHEDALYHGITPAGIEALAEAAEPAKKIIAEKVRVTAPDEACTLLDQATDYIVEIFPIGMPGADALGPLWQRRFDFGKNVNACGQSVITGEWEKVIAAR